ncbi:hypothetical protein G6045_21445, partial [Streptomyces sp. YC504]|nr:hypothetical protein [Streptomyces mesophilus]
MSTEAQRADIPPRPATPPPPLASSRLPDHAPAADRVPGDSVSAHSASPDSAHPAELPPRPAGPETPAGGVPVPVPVQNGAESALSGGSPAGPPLADAVAAGRASRARRASSGEGLLGRTVSRPETADDGAPVPVPPMPPVPPRPAGAPAVGGDADAERSDAGLRPGSSPSRTQPSAATVSRTDGDRDASAGPGADRTRGAFAAPGADPHPDAFTSPRTAPT